MWRKYALDFRFAITLNDIGNFWLMSMNSNAVRRNAFIAFRKMETEFRGATATGDARLGIDDDVMGQDKFLFQ